MRMRLAALVLVAGCGIEQVDFVEEYTLKICEHDLECGDAAQQRFDGVLEVEDCVEVTRPEIYAWGRGCRYRAGQASQCVADLETLTCPGGGGLAPIPASCDQVYVNCGEVADDEDGEDPSEEGGSDPEDEPEDTEDPEDTGDTEDTDAAADWLD